MSGIEQPRPAIQIVYQDAHFLAVAKPVGLATTAPGDGPCLFREVRGLDPRAPRLHPLSRLDTQVSGLVVFARSPDANRVALAARKQGLLLRRYVGLSQRCPEPREGQLCFSIGLDPRDPRRRCALPSDATGPGVKPSRTAYAVRATSSALCMLDLFPITGRTHQLRVHTSAAGIPLLGDVAYGGARRVVLDDGRVLTARRVMLHCEAVTLTHPGAGQPSLSLSLPVPADMAKLWRDADGPPESLNPLPLVRT